MVNLLTSTNERAIPNWSISVLCSPPQNVQSDLASDTG